MEYCQHGVLSAWSTVSMGSTKLIIPSSPSVLFTGGFRVFVVTLPMVSSPKSSYPPARSPQPPTPPSSTALPLSPTLESLKLVVALSIRQFFCPPTRPHADEDRGSLQLGSLGSRDGGNHLV